VERVGAVGLEIQSFTSSVRGKQNAQRVFCGVGVKSLLYFLAASPACEAVNHFYTLVRPVGGLYCLLQDSFKVAFCAFPILGEDQHPAVIPLRCKFIWMPAKGWQSWGRGCP
jgi:hypothetical protein